MTAKLKEQDTKAIAALFSRYIEAFEQFDIDAARQCYTLPCLLVTPDKLLLVEDEAQFKAEFAQIFDGLKQANFAKVGWRKPSINRYSKSCATVLIPWHFYDNEGKEFASFTGIYQLANIDSEKAQFSWRITQVVSHFDDASFAESINFLD